MFRCWAYCCSSYFQDSGGDGFRDSFRRLVLQKRSPLAGTPTVGNANKSPLTHLQYRTGEIILAGDVVEYHGDRGYVEFVVNGPTGDPEMDWYFRTNGTGVMVVEPKQCGRVYITGIENDEDLALVCRAAGI